MVKKLIAGVAAVAASLGLAGCVGPSGDRDDLVRIVDGLYDHVETTGVALLEEMGRTPTEYYGYTETSGGLEGTTPQAVARVHADGDGEGLTEEGIRAAMTAAGYTDITSEQAPGQSASSIWLVAQSSDKAVEVQVSVAPWSDGSTVFDITWSATEQPHIESAVITEYRQSPHRDVVIKVEVD